MKFLWLLLLLGCPQSSPPSPEKPPSQVVSPNAPLNLEKPARARVELDLAAVRGEVRRHQQLNGGKSPPSLSSMSIRLSYPDDLDYDPSSGAVKSRTYPSL